MPVFGLSEMTHASCVNPGQEAAVAAAQQAETSSPVVVEIEACGGDDTSYQIPLSVDVTFDGQVFEDVYVTTNSVITFGRPDGTYWDYPQTPSISLYSMDWVVYPQYREDEHLIIHSSDAGFQVDISARPIWLQQATDPTNIIITAAILSDGTVAMAYSLDGPTYDDQTRTGIRLNDGSIVDFETYGIDQVTESPELTPEPTTESPFIPEPEVTQSPEAEATESHQVPTASPESTVTESPEPEVTQSPEPVTASPQPEPEATESSTVSPEPTPSNSPEPEQPSSTPPFVPEGAMIFSEGQVAELVAPEGQVISSILGYYGDPNDSRNGRDISPVLSQFANSQSASIAATNEMFTDPAPGIVKIMILLVTYEPVEVSEPTNTSSPESTPEPEPTPETAPAPQPQPEPSQTPVPEPAPQPAPVEPEPIVTPEPQPSVEPSPEPNPEPIPTPTPVEPEPTPEPTPTPSETTEPAPIEPTPPVEEAPEVAETPEPQLPEPTLTPEPTPAPEPKEEIPTVDQLLEPSPEPTPTQDPEPVPTTPQEVTSDTPIENVIAVIENITPTSLTQEQAEVLVNIALQTFETAEPGSEEYEQALDLLLVAAQQDDIVVDEELAAAPVIGAAVVAVADALNALGNAGADMSPQVREQSEKVVVASVIVANIAITATSAATSAAAVAARRP